MGESDGGWERGADAPEKVGTMKAMASFGVVESPYCCVTLEGFALARLQYMHWEVQYHADTRAMRAAREAIADLPSNVHPVDLKNAIEERYFSCPHGHGPLDFAGVCYTCEGGQ